MDSVLEESISPSILAHLPKSGFSKTCRAKIRWCVNKGRSLEWCTKTHLRLVAPTRIFWHSASHSLNLVINDQSKVPIIRNICDIIRETIHFFRKSPKRRASLEINIALFSLTRWSEKCKSIQIFNVTLSAYLILLVFRLAMPTVKRGQKHFLEICFEEVWRDLRCVFD